VSRLLAPVIGFSGIVPISLVTALLKALDTVARDDMADQSPPS
jgi:hypothetical protein